MNMEENLISIEIRGYKFRLHTRPGIFSSKGLDDGTKLLLEKLLVKERSVVADLGSGMGIIGFVVAKLDPEGHVHLLEDHLRSYELLKENVEENKLEKQVEVFLSDLFSSVGERTYHQIISNPPQQLGNEFLKEVVEQSFNHLKPKGELWMVVKNNVKPFMKRILEEWFGSVKIEAQSREHIVLVAKKN